MKVLLSIIALSLLTLPTYAKSQNPTKVLIHMFSGHTEYGEKTANLSSLQQEETYGKRIEVKNGDKTCTAWVTREGAVSSVTINLSEANSIAQASGMTIAERYFGVYSDTVSCEVALIK